MRIGIVSDVSQAHRKWLDEAIAESSYQEETVAKIGQVLSKKYNVIYYVFDNDLVDKLKEDKIDLVFNLANGYENHQDRGELPALLEEAGIPYTGSSSLGHRICDDKALTAALLEKNHIKVPKTMQIHSILDLAGLEATFPLLVKPNNEGSGRGISNKSLVYNEEELTQVVQECLDTYHPPILITEYIEGKEVTLGILGNGDKLRSLPPLEIDFSQLPDHMEKIYSFEVKHEMEDLTQYHIPGRFSPSVTQEIQKVGERAFRALGLRDYARIDMRVKEGIPYILEINSLAGLNHESSDIVKTAEYAGIQYPELLDRIVEGAMKRYGIPMTPKDSNAQVQEIVQIREEENIQAKEEEIQEYKEAGLLPIKEEDLQEVKNTSQGKWLKINESIENLEVELLEVHKKLSTIKELVKEMENS